MPRKKQAEITSEKRKGKQPKCVGWNTGRKHPEETRRKISEGRRGIKTGPRPNLGAMSTARKGIPDEIIKCPHCVINGGKSIMKRWHFDKCRELLKK